MQSDQASVFGAFASVAFSILSSGVTFGIMKGRQEMLEKEQRELKEDLRAADQKFVTMKHFEAVVQPMQRRIDEIAHDTKEVLRIVRGDK